MQETLVILDYGSQYTQLIARRARELNVFSIILPYSASLDEVKSHNPKGIVLSGGPNSVFDKDAPGLTENILEQGIPVLGLCYGMQLATIEYARSVAKIRNAHTTEVEANVKHAVIHIMPEQEKMLLKREYGATMRLGAWECVLTPGTKTEKAYAKAGWIKPGARGKLANTITERHRHRYEFNNDYRERLEDAGLTISGTTPDGSLVEIIEITNHPFFIATQFHPEFKSRPFAPHPLFVEFVRAIAHAHSRKMAK